MNNLRKNIVVVLAALGMAGAAVGVQAQAPAPDGRSGQSMTQEQRQAKKAERHAKMAQQRAERQAKLHDALKLTPAQEPAWNAFVAAQKGERTDRGQRGDRADWKSLSAPQRMEKMIAMQKERTARMESRLAALNTFYAVLTPEQKKVFDEQAMRGHGGKRGHGHHGKMHG